MKIDMKCRCGGSVEITEPSSDGFARLDAVKAGREWRDAHQACLSVAAPPEGAVMVPVATELLTPGAFTKEPLFVLLEGDETTGYRLTFRQAESPAAPVATTDHDRSGELLDFLLLQGVCTINGGRVHTVEEVEELMPPLRESLDAVGAL